VSAVDRDQLERCARGQHGVYNKEQGGYDCRSCERHFTLRGFNTHVYAARRALKAPAS
jgi:hypothetical protein